MQLLSLFSGIGAFEKALDNLHIPYELVGYCEIDKYASKSYAAIHNVPEAMNLGDITKVNEKALPKNIDLITYGFPCQDISVAGKQKGLFNADGTQTRSGLFFEALRIIEETQPRVAIAENVKNLVGKKFKEQFHIVLDALEQAGYNNYWQVLNAKDYGIPQNRERVFIVSIRMDIDTGLFQFPKGFPLELRLKDMLEDVVDEKFYLSNKMVEYFTRITSENKARGNGNIYIPSDIEGCSKTITTKEGSRVRDNFIEEPRCIQVGFLDRPTTHDFSNRVYSTEGIARTLMGSGGNQNDKAGQYLVRPSDEIHRVDIPQIVNVRKYPVDIDALKILLRSHKNMSNKDIAEELGVPQTMVEHWFRTDDCFSIPDSSVWFGLKALLNIKTNEFDESIMTFEEKEGVFEKANRCYFDHGIAPTLTSTSADEKIITSDPFIVASRGRNPENPSDRTVGSPTVQRLEPNSQGICNTLTSVQKDNYVCEPTLRIRKLTPKECFRLMGFDDSDFEKAEKVNSNTQLYKQAGNSIVVQVLEHLLNALVECGAFGGKPKEQEVVGQLSFCDNVSLERYIEKEIKQCAF